MPFGPLYPGLTVITGTGFELADGSVTTPKLANLAVSNTKMASLAVSTPKIQDGNVSSPKVAETLIQQTDILIFPPAIKSLRATPVVVVPGKSSRIVDLIKAHLVVLSGSDPLTEAGDNLAFRMGGATGLQVSEDIEMTGFIDPLPFDINVTNAVLPKKDVIGNFFTDYSGQDLVLHNIGAAEFGGDSGDEAIIAVHVLYRIGLV